MEEHFIKDVVAFSSDGIVVTDAGVTHIDPVNGAKK
jgi:hypothetical protein